MKETRFAILADRQFGPLSSKTANGCIRYTPDRVAVVIDSEHAGRSVQDVLGFGGDIPVVATLDEAFAREPTDLLIGIAPVGGRLPDSWVELVRRAIERGLGVWSGLHEFLAEHPAIGPLARERGVEIRDLRRPPAALPVASGRTRGIESTVVLTVGSDCNIGKMTAALQIRDALRNRGRSVAFAGTGQTGILIEGWGIAVDAVVADFINGAAEQLVLDAAREAEIVLVEGQGSIIHPGYSGVTYGLMHGSLPHAMILCVQPTRRFCETDPWLRIPSLTEMVDLHERVLAPLRPSRVIGISLFTADLPESDARLAIEEAGRETGLPAADPVRFDSEPLAEAIERVHLQRVADR